MNPKPVQRGKPFYVHMPSVRPMVSSTIRSWFVHALEAKADAEVLEEVLREAQNAPKETKRHLNAIAKLLKQRRLLRSRKYSGDIHFVVVDNAGFYHEKPAAELHTPAAAQLAALLNKIGNKYGVFVHYVTPAETRLLLPALLPPKHPFAHFYGERVKIGPGEGTNIALSYITAFHEKRYGENAPAYLLRMSDDTFPSLNKVKVSRLRRKKYRSFFTDQLDVIAGKLKTRSGYVGWRDDDARRARKGDYLPALFTVRHAPPSKLPFYATGFNEDVNYTAGVTSFRTPGYLFHGGKRTTHKKNLLGDSEAFGYYGGGQPVTPASKEFVDAVAARSKLDLLEHARPPTSRGGLSWALARLRGLLPLRK